MGLTNMRGRAALILAEQDFDVDQIVGISNIKEQDPEALSKLVLKWCDAEFAERQRPGDFIIAGPNFGYGHPHYPTMIGMRKLGISGVIGEHFAPGYWIGEISKGFPQISCSGILASTDRWDELEVDWEHLLVRNHTKNTYAPFERLASSELATLEAGGFLSYLQQYQMTH